jgi:hypothetical protein
MAVLGLISSMLIDGIFTSLIDMTRLDLKQYNLVTGMGFTNAKYYNIF